MSKSTDAKSPLEYLHTIYEPKVDGEHAQRPIEYLPLANFVSLY